LTANVQHVASIRAATARYLSLPVARAASQTNLCYNCRATSINNRIAFPAGVALLEALDAQSLLISFVDDSTFTGAAVTTLV
jgi:hypothetical protein